jgi:hypothetical protein
LELGFVYLKAPLKNSRKLYVSYWKPQPNRTSEESRVGREKETQVKPIMETARCKMPLALPRQPPYGSLAKEFRFQLLFLLALPVSIFLT